MFKASVTSKGQVTIPKEIREILDINKGDNIIFNVDIARNIVIVAKDIETIDCVICQTRGEIESYDGQEKYRCPVCSGAGQIRKGILVIQEIGNLMSTNLNYGIGITIITYKEDGTKIIPEITLVSKLYTKNTLDLIQDYYQERLIEEFAPNYLYNQSNCTLVELLNLIKTDIAKEKVRTWFRHYRNSI